MTPFPDSDHQSSCQLGARSSSSADIFLGDVASNDSEAGAVVVSIRSRETFVCLRRDVLRAAAGTSGVYLICNTQSNSSRLMKFGVEGGGPSNAKQRRTSACVRQVSWKLGNKCTRDAPPLSNGNAQERHGASCQMSIGGSYLT